MANLAEILKEEIRRLARKEIRTQSGGLKQAVSRYRREIAALKRQLAQQAKKLQRLERNGHAAVASALAAPSDEGLDGVRFSAKSVRSQRRRLGFSAADYGRLVGVSGLTIYNWEQGKSRPRKSQLAALTSVRNIGKREAVAKLAS